MLIVDMEMPRGCYFCPFSETYPTHWFCRAFDDTTPIDGCAPMDKRRSWCPIKGELVRCGECKYFYGQETINGIKAGKCKMWQMCAMPNYGLMRADHFCADGERKDGEHDK